MTLPAVKVEVAFATDPFTAPTWTDVTAYLRSVSIRRGKQRVLDSMQPGTATVVLDNNDQRFDPNNTAGPYSPNVVPMRKVRVTATHSATPYGLFYGFIEAWPQSFPNLARDSVVTVNAVDGFKILNLQDLTLSPAQQLSGARIGAVLDALSPAWPAADRNVDAGQTTVQASTLTAANPLQHLLQVVESENGLLYVDRDGKLRFISRHNVIAAVLDATNYTFGDAGGTEKPYRGAVIAYDDVDVWNEIKASSQGVAEQTASDSASQTKYLKRTLAKSALLLTSTSEQLDYARFLLEGFKEPALRVEGIEPLPERGDYWTRVLDRDLGAKIRVRLNPPGAGDVIQQDSYVEGIQWDIKPEDWRVSWDLVPVTRRADFWVLDDPVQGRLETNSRLAY